MPSGGYHPPANPAAISGPGALSKRTDGKQPHMQLSDAAYGEQKTYQEIQGGAPVPQLQSNAGGGAQLPPLVGLDAPSQQPDVPVTAGADSGPGPGSDALGLLSAAKADAQHFAKYMPALMDIADRDDTPPSVRRAIRNLYSNL